MPEAGAKHATPRGSDATSSTSTEARQGQHHDVAFKSIFLHAPNVSQSTNCCCLCKDTCLLEFTLQEGRTQSHPPEIIEYVRREEEGRRCQSLFLRSTRSCRRRSRGALGGAPTSGTADSSRWTSPEPGRRATCAQPEPPCRSRRFAEMDHHARHRQLRWK